ncbi:MAG TPA: hypothetical protein DG414_10390 [Gammaproteobacteria bacterium]|nr:hypothetical protein [Gammaproteobacteria bacterium]
MLRRIIETQAVESQRRAGQVSVPEVNGHTNNAAIAIEPRADGALLVGNFKVKGLGHVWADGTKPNHVLTCKLDRLLGTDQPGQNSTNRHLSVFC